MELLRTLSYKIPFFERKLKEVLGPNAVFDTDFECEEDDGEIYVYHSPDHKFPTQTLSLSGFAGRYLLPELTATYGEGRLDAAQTVWDEFVVRFWWEASEQNRILELRPDEALKSLHALIDWEWHSRKVAATWAFVRNRPSHWKLRLLICRLLQAAGLDLLSDELPTNEKDIWGVHSASPSACFTAVVFWIVHSWESHSGARYEYEDRSEGRKWPLGGCHLEYSPTEELCRRHPDLEIAPLFTSDGVRQTIKELSEVVPLTKSVRAYFHDVLLSSSEQGAEGDADDRTP